MSENFLIVFNLIGLTVFTLMGFGVYCAVSSWYWNHKDYGPYDLPLWIELGIIPFFALLWGGIMSVLMLTVWQPEVTAYTISVSW